MEIVKVARAQWDRIGAWLGFGLGALLLLLGWLGTSREAYPAAQIPYLVSGGLGGLVLVALGGLLWISADLRDEWRKLDDLQDEVRQLRELGAQWTAEPEAPPTNGSGQRSARARAR